MALLLAMYQKMRLIREKNQATLDLTKFSSKYDRVSKNIERVQKMYTSKLAALDSKAKLMQSQAKSIFQQASGLAVAGNSSYLNPYTGGAQNAFTGQFIQAMIAKGVMLKWKDESDTTKGTEKSDTAYKFGGLSNEQIMLILNNSNSLIKATPENKEKYDYLKDVDDNYYALVNNEEVKCSISENDLKMLQLISNGAQQEYFNRSNWLQQANSNYETNVSIWLESAKAQIEAEQDAALEPLNYQQTMWELEKEQAEQRLERIKADLESYTRLCSEEAKEQAPKFGLG